MFLLFWSLALSPVLPENSASDHLDLEPVVLAADFHQNLVQQISIKI